LVNRQEQGWSRYLVARASRIPSEGMEVLQLMKAENYVTMFVKGLLLFERAVRQPMKIEGCITG
jgi:hypothetical protein